MILPGMLVTYFNRNTRYFLIHPEEDFRHDCLAENEPILVICSLLYDTGIGKISQRLTCLSRFGLGCIMEALVREI